MAAFDPGSGGLLGGHDLQESIDRLTSAVTSLTTAYQGSRQGNGLNTSPFMSASSQGQTFSTGSLNGMASGGGANGGGASFGGRFAGAALLGQGASGGGANAGGSSRRWSAGSAIPYGGSYSGYPTPAGPLTSSGSYYSGGSGAIGGGGAGGSSGMPGAGFATSAVQAAGSFAGWAINSGMGQLNNQLLFNAYGQQMAASWGGSAQGYQNSAFGNGTNGVNNNAAAGNAQSAAQEFGTLTQMAGGANVTSTAAFGATNAIAFANQGIGAAGASQVAAQVYNPQRALQQQLLTGVSAFNPNGSQASLSSQISGLANLGYLGGGGYSSKTGTFNQKALNASFTANRGTSFMNLQSLGYSASQIQDLQSVMSQANGAALKGHTSMQDVLNTMNTAEYAQGGQASNANSQLAKWGINLSTLQKQGNQSAQNLSQQQSQSSTYNQGVSDFTSAMTKMTSAVNWFLDKTGLNKALGGVQGAGAGYQSTGMSSWVSGIAHLAGMGGGAAAVSTTMQMGSNSKTAGSTMSSVPGQVSTAVRDAEGQVGKPYVYGGSNPQTSFDCSGLVQWSYGQAGVKLPRTSQQQWAALRNKSVPLNQVREGDVLFSAGSDGTASAPGHEALAISGNQIVEAPYTGANIRIRAYNPGEWQHAGRPVGGTSNGSNSNSVSTSGGGGRLSSGNTGALIGGDSALGLTSDADSLLFGGGGGGGLMRTTVNGGATSNTASSSGIGSTNFTGGGSASQNEALAKQMAAQLYGWTGNQWTDGLLPLWTQESGFRTNAKNPSSGAFGIPQSLPASKMASAGSDYLTNPATQIKWGLGDIKQMYGSPLGAEQHERSYNWYGKGGPIIVGDRGPEAFVPDQSGTIMNAKDTANLLRGNSAQVAQAPWTTSPAQQLLLDTLTPANNHAQAGGGVTVTIGQISVNAPNMTGNSTTSDVQVIGQLLVSQVEESLQRSNLISDIRKGVTG